MDMEKVIKGLEHCKKYGSLGGNDCNGHYEYTDNLQEIIKANNHRKDCSYGQCRTGCVVTLVADVIALLKEQEKEIKALRLLIEWATDCDFGFDQFPEEYERYKDEITDMKYIEGMIHIAKRTLEDHGSLNKQLLL